MEALFDDIRSGLHRVRQRPGFTAVAVAAWFSESERTQLFLAWSMRCSSDFSLLCRLKCVGSCCSTCAQGIRSYSVVLVLVALSASDIPARRLAGIDPCWRCDRSRRLKP